jgi:hypothetical protein
VSGPPPLPPSGVDRAALAFSILPAKCADVVNRRLTVVERMRLREGLARVRSATDDERLAAIKALATEVDQGMNWPRPSMHDDADCPFRVVESHPRARVIDVLERIAAREPLEVAVTLCHLSGGVREELWHGLSSDARAAIMPELDDVHGVSSVRTRAYARDIAARTSRAIRRSGGVGV